MSIFILAIFMVLMRLGVPVAVSLGVASIGAILEKGPRSLSLSSGDRLNSSLAESAASSSRCATWGSNPRSLLSAHRQVFSL